MKISKDFEDFLKLLHGKKVEYLIIGGYAVNHYGYVRNTGDLDIWVRLNEGNISLVAEALDEFGYAPKEESLKYLRIPGKILRMGIPPFRLEVSTNIDGVMFEDCYPHRVTLTVNEFPVNIISYDDLIKNKKSAGRLKDLADVEELEIRNTKAV